jgi:hypothetical protein
VRLEEFLPEKSDQHFLIVAVDRLHERPAARFRFQPKTFDGFGATRSYVARDASGPARGWW